MVLLQLSDLGKEHRGSVNSLHLLFLNTAGKLNFYIEQLFVYKLVPRHAARLLYC